MTNKAVNVIGIASLAGVLASTSASFAQDPPRSTAQAQTQNQRGAGRQPGRPVPPAGGPNDPQQIQAWLDAWALIQAERELQLSAEQYSTFVPRLTRLQNARRRGVMARRQLMREINGLLTQNPVARDEQILEKVRAYDDIGQRVAEEVRKAAQELDAVLTPWQRGRYRLFEEQIERRKIDLLTKVGAGRGEAPPPRYY